MKPRTAARLAWSLWAAYFVFGGAGLILEGANGRIGFLPIGLGIALAGFPTVGALIASRLPSNAIGWLFLAFGLGPSFYEFARQYATHSLITHPGSLPGGVWMAWVSTWISLPTFASGLTFLILLFPNGRLPSRRWRPVAWLAAATIIMTMVGNALDPGEVPGFPGVRNPAGIAAGAPNSWFLFLLFPALAAVSVVSLVLRFRRSRGDERQQLKWFTYAVVLTMLAFPSLVGIGLLPPVVSLSLMFLLLALVPVSVGIAILRHRLYDIDVVINKTIVYGALALFLTGIYLGLVVGVGAWVAAGSGYNPSLSVLATAIVAIAFQPLRTRLQRIANRIVYGERATPYEAMAGFSQQMAASFSLEEVLPRMAEAAARGIAATGTRVKIFLPGGTESVASWPPGSSDAIYERTVPVIHQSETVGEIAVAKAANDPITPAEKKLLDDLATQAGPAMRNVRLTEDLRASRARIVAAQDDERRKIERDIHDGAQSQLVSMAVKLGLVSGLLGRDPEKAAKIVEELKSEAGAAVETLRDLARGVFPRLLADNGLVAALEAHLAKTAVGAKFTPNLPDGARFDLQIEGAIYFCIREAIQNAGKHASGAEVSVRLWIDNDQFAFTVTDEGPGFDLNAVKLGSGLQNMKDRVEALGGDLTIDSSSGRGTTITGQIPLSP